ncbi:polymerase [Limosilactobacillus reuteri]|uniref:polymerase n=1 Tax=Limosilactobacillus reuteri TaxID=1598 RepID=UPI001E529C6E|nr:polymerase [Limosilactobacillus reuteri]MCC4399302.1 polymerase [Limosilactobacillus reuteri]MCC4403439.1 polymerase [Limosilactobacillus reuteri]
MWDVLLLRIKKIFNVPINRENLYLSTMVFYIFVLFLRNTTFDPYIGSRPFNIASYLVILILVFKIFVLDDSSIKQKIVSFFILTLAAISWRNSNSNLIIVMMSFILAADKVNFRKIVKFYFGTAIIILSFVIFFSLIGVIKDLVFVVPGRATRYSLGIIYPTDLAAHILYLLLAHEYLNFRKINWKYYIGYFIVAIITKLITDARLSVLCMILSIAVLIIAKLAERYKIFQKFISTFWMYIPIATFIAFVSAYFFDKDNHLFFTVDRMLSGRLGYGHLAMELYPVTWFGQRIVEHGLGGNSGMKIFNNHNNGYFFIDSSYIRLILMYGLAITIVVIIMMTLVSIKGLSRHQYELTAIILVITFSCLVEQHLLEVSFNPFLLALLANIKSSEVNYEK